MVVSGSPEDPIERLPDICPYRMDRSMSQTRMAMVGSSYPYSIHVAAFCAALGGFFGRSCAMTHIDFVRVLKREISDLEAPFHFPRRILPRHQRIVMPILWNNRARELREEMLKYISETPEYCQWLANESLVDGPDTWGSGYGTDVDILLGDDLGEPRTITMRIYPRLHIFVPGNKVAFLVLAGVDPTKQDLYLRLPNDALLQISWWEPIAAPKPELQQRVQLEVHIRDWPRKPVHLIPAVPSAQHAQCWFYCLNNPTTAIILWIPVLVGNWVVLANHMSVLNAKGIVAGPRTVVVRNEPTRTRALVPTSLWEPVAVRTFAPPIIVWRILCRACYRKDPQQAYSAAAHFC